MKHAQASVALRFGDLHELANCVLRKLLSSEDHVDRSLFEDLHKLFDVCLLLYSPDQSRMA